MCSGHPGPAADRDFVGRIAELAKLAELAQKVRAGQHQTAVLRGPAGIGKSGLIRRFVATLEDFAVLRATGDPAEQMLQLGVIDQLLSRVPTDLRARTPSLAGGVPPEANPIAVGSQLLGLLGDLQRHSPIAVVVDDLQWADQASRQTLRYVLRRMWAVQLLVVLAGRSPDREVEELVHGIPTDLRLELGGLDLVDVAELAKSISGVQMPSGAARRLHTYTGGHPLLLRTLLTELFTQRFTTTDWWLAVPPSVTSAVRRTFAKLPESSRLLLEALSVLGGRPPLAQVAEVAGVDDAHAALGPAIDAGLATWFPSAPACPVAISHDLQRETIYTDLTPVRRYELHQRAATTVEHVLAWRHRVAALSSPDAGLAAELEEAAGREAEQGNYGTSATLLSWAADVTPGSDQRERLFLTAMVHSMFSSTRGRARNDYDRAARCAPSALRSLALGLCELYLVGERGLAEQHLTEAFELSRRGWIRGSAASGLTTIRAWRGDLGQALSYAAFTLDADGVPAPQRDYIRCVLAVLRVRRSGLAAGLDELRFLAGHASDVPNRDLESLACRGAIRAQLGLADEARGDLAEVVRRQLAGVPMLSGVQPHCYLAAVQYESGEWDESLLTMRTAALLADDDEPLMNEVLRSLAASLVPSARGDWRLAESLVHRAGEAAQRIGGPQDLRYAAIASALLCQARDDSSGMLQALSAVPGLRGSRSESAGLHEWWSSWWGPLLIEGLQREGELAEAARELAALRVRTRGMALMGSTLIRLTAQQVEAGGDIRRALSMSEQFLTRYLAPRPRLADGLLFHAHGRQLLALGDTTGAAKWLAAAGDCFTALGALPYRRRAAADLTELEGRSAPGADHGLTSREQEVADLVLGNLTNREIAARLHVTPKTVEYHLRNVFAKLGISSRRELRRPR
ncbi:AAA family ATPase [Kribbella sp. NPDC023855]|uniref:ATP-binding protein n=1 Tax=Kribbella sp. NPDC023855 TaxID=3154698 RepID=UPI0033E16C75